MATPLTVCLVVLGKHVPGLRFVGLLMADTPALAPEYSYYQRLLARDQAEAADLIEQYIKAEPPRSVYDALLLPALNYAERDRLELRLSTEEEMAVIDATRELLSDTAEWVRTLEEQPAPHAPIRILGYAANGAADNVALTMLGHVMADLPLSVEILSGRMQATELVAAVRAAGVAVVCLADLPPSPSSKTRYLVKRLRAALPQIRIVVGRWGPPSLQDDSTHALRQAGANLVATTLAETRTYLEELVPAGEPAVA